MSMLKLVVEYVNRRAAPTTTDDLLPAFRGYRRAQVADALRRAKASGLIAGRPGTDAARPAIYTPKETS